MCRHASAVGCWPAVHKALVSLDLCDQLIVDRLRRGAQTDRYGADGSLRFRVDAFGLDSIRRDGRMVVGRLDAPTVNLPRINHTPRAK